MSRLLPFVTYLFTGMKVEKRIIVRSPGSADATVYDQNLTLYNWVRNHQGFFVPISEKAQPNPYLHDIADHRATTDSGKPLTLVIPEQLLHQIYETRPNGSAVYWNATPQGRAPQLETSGAESLFV